MKQAVDRAFQVIEQAEDAEYIGEAVSQLEHALQCAHFASQSGHSEAVVLASLLHDIGHYVSPTPQPEMDGLGVVDHEKIGADYLREWGFDEKIAVLVENHVTAKRYLAAKNPSYCDKLSPASQATLKFQGGPLSPAEMLTFEQSPYFQESIQVRVNDEKGKVMNLDVPSLAHYRTLAIKYSNEHLAPQQCSTSGP